VTTPECATEQIEHSWLGTLELSECTWTAWTTPVQAISRTHNKDRKTMHMSLRDLRALEIKKNTSPVQ
jgi:hypothetical protein